MPEVSESIRIPVAAVQRIPEIVREAGAPDALEARCVACGIKLGPDELIQIADARVTSPRLERLRLGYCARNTCESRFYDVSAVIQSTALRDAMNSLATQLPDLTNTSAALPLNRSTTFRVAGAAMLVGLILFVLHHGYYGGRIPLLQKPHHFRASPPPIRGLE